MLVSTFTTRQLIATALLSFKSCWIFPKPQPNEMHFSTRQFTLSTRQCLCPLVRFVRRTRQHNRETQWRLVDSLHCVGPKLCLAKHLKHFLEFSYMNIATNLPGVFSMILMTSGSLDDALGSATISRAFILFFCSFNSNSILKNPAQYNRIDITEIMEVKEGELCF